MVWFKDWFRQKVKLGAVPRREFLTKAKLQQLFGDNYNWISYYDFDTARWNPSRNVSQLIDDKAPLGRDALKMKANVESMPDFKPFELVAAVVMAVDVDETCGIIKPIVHQPIFWPGCGVVGNVVVRDRTSGRIMPVSDYWVGVHRFHAVHEISDAGCVFVQKCSKWGSPYVKILGSFVRNARQK